MNVPEQSQDADRRVETLAAFDESLAAQRAPGGARTEADEQPGSRGESQAPHERQLEREIECLRVLERVWPRSGRRGEAANDEARMTNDEATAIRHSSFGNSSFEARFGRFEIRRPLGCGAHGFVFLAYDPTLRREVALKIPRPEVLISSEVRGRFVREARVSAALDHPNIVTVFEAGQVGAACYIAVAYCRGPTLADWLKDRNEPFSARDSALLVAILAEAMAHAHARGVLHRDLKPGNILLDRPTSGVDAGTSVPAASLGYIPKISDFGLAKFNDAQPDRTKSGALLGTIAYMAPEQAAAGSRHGGQVSAASDIYSLGVILYELLTGRPPFQGESPLEVLQQVREVEVVPPTRLRRRIPRDLETICLKCLEKNPRDRYATAAALAADLRCFLRGAPVQARPVRGVQRLWRWCRRNPALAAASGLATLGLFLSAVVSASFAIHQATAARQLQAEKQQTQAALERAETEFAAAQRQSAIWALDHGLRLCEQGEPARGMLWLARSLKIVAALDQADAGELQRCIRANLGIWRHELVPLVGVFDHGAAIDGVALSHDGTKIVTDGIDGNVKLWDARTGHEIAPPMVHEANVIPVAISPCGRFVLTGSSDNRARLWDTQSGTVVAGPLAHPADVRVVVFCQDGRVALTGTTDGARLWDIASLCAGLPTPHGAAARSGAPPPHLPHPAGSVTAARFLPNSRRVVTGSWDHKVRIWDISKGALVAVLPHEAPVYCLAVSPDGRRLVSGSSDGEARVWDARTGKPIGDALPHPDQVMAAAFREGDEQVLTVCGDRKLRLWDPATGILESTTLPIATSEFAAAITPDGRTVVTAGRDGLARLWDASQKASSDGFVLQHPDEVRAACCSPDGRFIATGSMDHAARLWDVATGNQVGPPLAHGARVLAVAFSPDGDTLATSSADNTARLWNVETLSPRTPPLAHPDKVNAVAFSPDGRIVITACEDGVARFWNPQDGSLRPSLQLKVAAATSAVTSVALSPDGRLIITGEASGAVRVWDAHTGDELTGTMFHLGKVLGVAVSPDGRTLLTAATDMTARLWDFSSQQPIGRPLAHHGKVRSAAFSPDGRLAVTGSNDGTARLWDVATLRPVGPPLVHEGPVGSVAFEPEGRAVLTGSFDKTVRRWMIATPVDEDPALVERRVEALTGIELDEDGLIHSLDRERWHELRELGDDFRSG